MINLWHKIKGGKGHFENHFGIWYYIYDGWTSVGKSPKEAYEKFKKGSRYS